MAELTQNRPDVVRAGSRTTITFTVADPRRPARRTAAADRAVGGLRRHGRRRGLAGARPRRRRTGRSRSRRRSASTARTASSAASRTSRSTASSATSSRISSRRVGDDLPPHAPADDARAGATPAPAGCCRRWPLTFVALALAVVLDRAAVGRGDPRLGRRPPIAVARHARPADLVVRLDLRRAVACRRIAAVAGVAALPAPGRSRSSILALARPLTEFALKELVEPAAPGRRPARARSRPVVPERPPVRDGGQLGRAPARRRAVRPAPRRVVGDRRRALGRSSSPSPPAGSGSACTGRPTSWPACCSPCSACASPSGSSSASRVAATAASRGPARASAGGLQRPAHGDDVGPLAHGGELGGAVDHRGDALGVTRRCRRPRAASSMAVASSPSPPAARAIVAASSGCGVRA